MSFDLAIFQPSTPGAPYLQALAVPGTPGRGVQGAEKLAQRFILCLFTQLGSRPYQPALGTNLPSTLAGNIISELDLMAAFGSALPMVQAQLQAAETAEMPADERYASAQLGAVTVSTDTTTANILVTSLAGTTAGFTLPLVLD